MACPENILKEYESKYAKNPIKFVQQRWDYSIAEGFYEKLKEDCTFFSFPPITTFPVGKCIFHKNRKVKSDEGIEFNILPAINVPILKQFFYIVTLAFKLCNWGFRNRKHKQTILTHCIYPQSAIPAFIARFLTGCKVFSVVPDLPEHSVPYMYKKHPIMEALYKLFVGLSTSLKHMFDGYICVSKYQMDYIKSNSPYMIMEGTLNFDLFDSLKPTALKTQDKIIIYAGGILEKYGAKLLIDGFVKASIPNTQLWFFGYGDCEEYILQNECNNVKYNGNISRKELIGIEKSAFLLVNPRPTHEEYSKCSFPSKLMDYMATGTPVLTSKLLCIGEEYDDLMLYFNEITADGISEGLINAINNPKLKEIGIRAEQHMRNKKNSLYQATRVINFIENN